MTYESDWALIANYLPAVFGLVGSCARLGRCKGQRTRVVRNMHAISQTKDVDDLEWLVWSWWPRLGHG